MHPTGMLRWRRYMIPIHRRNRVQCTPQATTGAARGCREGPVQGPGRISGALQLRCESGYGREYSESFATMSRFPVVVFRSLEADATMAWARWSAEPLRFRAHGPKVGAVWSVADPPASAMAVLQAIRHLRVRRVLATSGRFRPIDR